MPDPTEGDIRHGVPPIAVSTGSTRENRTGSWKYVRPVYRDKVAPCVAACPAGVDVEGCLRLLREGRVAEARDLLLRENPLPAVTGRVCDHPCQAACSRAAFDDAVNVHAIERVLGELEPEAPDPVPARTRPGTVAVVGSGPAGLACAWHLARLGYGVDVFEADPEPGGALRHAIPEYRLPRAVLAREIERVRAAGVAIHCGVRVGADRPWKDLDGWDAVFLATGARVSRPFEIEGREQADVRPGLEFLRAHGAGDRGPIGRHVVVVGGTDTAVDCARTALRLGAEPVILCRGSRDDLAACSEAVDEAIREGVRFEFHAWPVGIREAAHAEDEPAMEAIGAMFDEDAADRPAARLMGVTCVRTRPATPGPDGTRRHEPVPGSAFVLPAETLLTALGEEPDLGFLPPAIERRAYVVKVDALGRTNDPRFFAGGDITGGPRTVAHSLGSGKAAAIAIDRALRARAGEAPPEPDVEALRPGGTGGISITRWRGDDPIPRTNAVNEVVRPASLNLAHFAPVAGKPDRHRSFEERRSGFAEANLGLTPNEALAEARRCFECGVCNDCELCLVFCPDIAIRRRPGGHGFSLSYKHCKGCGLCVEECPRGAMDMTREGLS